jgi:hypothetical protein
LKVTRKSREDSRRGNWRFAYSGLRLEQSTTTVWQFLGSLAMLKTSLIKLADMIQFATKRAFAWTRYTEIIVLTDVSSG